MAKPTGSIKSITTPDNVSHSIVPDSLGSGSYVASLPQLSQDDTVALLGQDQVFTNENEFKIGGQYPTADLDITASHISAGATKYGNNNDIIEQSNLWIDSNDAELNSLGYDSDNDVGLIQTGNKPTGFKSIYINADDFTTPTKKTEDLIQSDKTGITLQVGTLASGTTTTHSLKIDSTGIKEDDVLLSSKYQATLPTTSTAGKVLKSTSTAGVVEWGDVQGGSGVTIVTTPGSESISDGTNTLDVATRNTAQTIGGAKTFTSDLTVNNGTEYNNGGLHVTNTQASISGLYTTFDGNDDPETLSETIIVAGQNGAGIQNRYITSSSEDYHILQADKDAVKIMSVSYDSNSNETINGTFEVGKQGIKINGNLVDSTYQKITDNTLNTTNKTIPAAINEVNSIAKSADIAKGFTSYQALITELNGATSTAYKVGQSFFIQTLNVPDLWIMSVESSSVSYTYTTDAAFITATGASGGQQVGYYKLAQLETLKVDLTNYSTKSETVSNVSYDGTNKKLQQTINGTTTDIVAFGSNAFTNTTIPTITSNVTQNSDDALTSGGAYTALLDKMNTTDPTGTGSFSLNRAANTTIGTKSFAEGIDGTASGHYSHAEGQATTSSGSATHSEGDHTTASGFAAHAEGRYTTASGSSSHAQGNYTIAQRAYQFVFGENNIADITGNTTTRGTFIEIVGNGSSFNNRSNARTLDWDGNEWIAGRFQAAGGLTDGNNANYELQLPDTTSWTADKTIATTDQITTVNDATLTIQLNGSNVETFTANADSNKTANIKALPNYSLSIGSTNAGNPRQVKFLSVNYTNYDGNNACFIKLGAMCSHGNGASYIFMDDIFIGVSSSGSVTCDVYKYFQADPGSGGDLDGSRRYYGDVYYVINTTNKIVDFYILVGQYSTANFTPYTKIGATTTTGITQLSGSATYYSSGTRNWATGDSTIYARKSDLPDVGNATTVSTSGAVSQTMQPYMFYDFTGSLTSLTLTTAAPAGGKAPVYMAKFYSGATAPTLSVTLASGTPVWSMCTPSMISTYTYYEIYIAGNVVSLVPATNKYSVNINNTLATNSVEMGVGGTVSLTRTSDSQPATAMIIGSDTYQVSATASVNFSVYSIKKNGVAISNNSTFTASEDIDLDVVFKGATTTITYNTPTGASVTVKKDSSSGTSISSGGSINFYDRVYIAVSASSGYTTSFSVSGLKATGTSNIYLVTALTPSITVTATANS